MSESACRVAEPVQRVDVRVAAAPGGLGLQMGLPLWACVIGAYPGAPEVDGLTWGLPSRIGRWPIGFSNSMQCPPAEIKAVTFTNKAAREMMTCLGSLSVSAHHRDAGLPVSFQIPDSQAQPAPIKRLLRGLDYSGIEDAGRDCFGGFS